MLVSDIIAEVRRIVQLRPDVTYNASNYGCKYADGYCSDGSVGCIFGQVLSNLGERVQRFDEYPIPDCNKTYTPSIGKILENEFGCSDNEYVWCERVQELQDNGLSWGEAVKMTDMEFPL